MKKIICTFSILLISITSFSQTCEERESKLLEAMGSFSAAAMYNSYGVVGSIADGFGGEVYKAEMVNSLLNAQIALCNNLVKVMDSLKTANILTTQSDKNYATDAIEIFNGLKNQANLFLDYIKDKSQQKMDDYSNQRDKNWKDLCKLMGIKE
jgi:hypothetical protein